MQNGTGLNLTGGYIGMITAHRTAELIQNQPQLIIGRLAFGLRILDEDLQPKV